MDERNELIVLYDYYKELLSDSQRKYFEYYYFNNYSLGEIAEELNISRNAVHKQLKSAEEKLYFFEKKLNIIEKSKKIEKIIEKIDDNKIKEGLKNIIES